MIARYRNRRFLMLLFLVFSVAGMSVGFSAFSKELVITSSAIVQPDSSSFRVLFSSSSSSLATDKISGIPSGNAVGGLASIDNDGDKPTISDLSATFTAPGQSVTYTFYTHNAGAYTAYLTDINFNTITGQNFAKRCTAIDPTATNETLLAKACEDIVVNVEVGGLFADGSIHNIKNEQLDRGVNEKVVVTISYENNNNISNNDFVVEFGDLSLTYSSANPGASNS